MSQGYCYQCGPPPRRLSSPCQMAGYLRHHRAKIPQKQTPRHGEHPIIISSVRPIAPFALSHQVPPISSTSPICINPHPLYEPTNLSRKGPVPLATRLRSEPGAGACGIRLIVRPISHRGLACEVSENDLLTFYIASPLVRSLNFTRTPRPPSRQFVNGKTLSLE